MIHGANPTNGLRSNHSSTPQLDGSPLRADTNSPDLFEIGTSLRRLSQRRLSREPERAGHQGRRHLTAVDGRAHRAALLHELRGLRKLAGIAHLGTELVVSELLQVRLLEFLT